VAALGDVDPTVREWAVRALARAGGRRAVRHLVRMLGDEEMLVRMEAAESLGDLLTNTKRSPRALVARLRDTEHLVRLQAAESLGYIRDLRVAPALWRMLGDRVPLVRRYAAAALGMLGDKRLVRRLQDRLEQERAASARLGYYLALHDLGQHSRLADVVGSLDSRDTDLVCAAANGLARIATRSNGRAILGALRKALRREPTVAGRATLRAAVQHVRKRTTL
jgi:HEAT repeat protein